MIPEPPESVRPSGRFSTLPPPLSEHTLADSLVERASRFVDHMGGIGVLTARTTASLLRRPLEIASTIYQIESLGVRSLGIVAVTSIFIGMVMT
ncbi:MAG: ABC transporter permease, partial [Myxococcota bacterium]|nr:ABC transporter permease [Myxococcota bacterium]